MLEIKSTDSIDVVRVENTQGFDGHCLRAAYYFSIPDINLTDPESVNAIKKSHPNLRRKSKAPTFA